MHRGAWWCLKNYIAIYAICILFSETFPYNSEAHFQGKAFNIIPQASDL